MISRSWIRHLFARKPRTVRKAPARCRPAVEALEPRMAPATAITVSSTADVLHYKSDVTVAQLLAGQDLASDNTSNDTTITLRDAINAANNSGGSNTIQLQANTTYTLTVVDNATDGATGLPVIASGNNLTIAGNGDTIGRDTTSGTAAFRLFDVAAGATLTLQGALTLQNGLAYGAGVSAQGGAIYSQGTLNLDTVTVQNNRAQGSDGTGIGDGNNAAGGGVFVAGGTATLTDATLNNNSAQGGNGNVEGGGFATGHGSAFGGALFLAQVTVTASNLLVSGNSADNGGGIDNDGTMTLDNSIVTSNSAVSADVLNPPLDSGIQRFDRLPHGGGGIDNDGTMTLNNCMVASNSAALEGGGIFNTGMATINTSTLSKNSANESRPVVEIALPLGHGGGGIENDGTLMVTNSTLSGNFCTDFASGGGIANAGTLTVSGSTLLGNSTAQAPGDFWGGGGIACVHQIGGSNAVLTVTNSTFSGNSTATLGGGIDIIGSTATISDCTFSGNSAPTVIDGMTAGNVLGGGINNGGLLTLNISIVANSIGGDIQNPLNGGSHNLIDDGSGGLSDTITGDPMLGPLQDNGGPTQSMALLPGSPAIDAGDNSAPGLPSTDQRGFARIIGNAVDIGAYESGTTAATTDLSVTIQAADSAVLGGPLTYTLTVTNNSSSPQSNVTLVDGLSANTTLVSWMPINGTNGWSTSAPAVGQSGTVSAWIPSLEEGTSAQFTRVVQVNSNAALGTIISNTASVGPITGDPNPSNNSVSVQTTVTQAVPTVTVTDAGGTYNGNPFPATATAVGVDGTTPVAGSFTYAYYTGSSAAGTPSATAPTNAGTYTVVATFTSSDPTYTNGSAQTTFTISPATPNVTVTDGGTYNGNAFTAVGSAVGVDGKTAVAGSFSYTYYASDGSTVLTGAPTNAGSYFVVAAFTSSDPNYTNASSAQTAFTISPALLVAQAVNFSATAGAPFTGTVATFTNPVSVLTAASYTALITWGDGSTSAGVISGIGSTLTVTGSHTFAAPVNETVSVQISNILGNTTTATVTDTATVTSLGLGVTRGLTGSIGFWHCTLGQALITSFNGGATSTALANWLAATFPNLYGASAGSNDLAGQTNAQVAAFFQTEFRLGGTEVQAQVLAVAINVYATTASLGGNVAAAYGFTVNATGLGARSVNVGNYGAAFGVANGTTFNVYQLLLAVNQMAVSGVLYGGNATLQAEAAQLFNALNTVGSVPL
jgi:hypothetical protein